MGAGTKQLLRVAIEKCTSKLEQHKDVYNTLIKRGVLWGMAGNYKHSIQDFSRAIELNPVIMDPYFFRAYTFLSMDNFQEALKDFCQAKQMDIAIESLTVQGKNQLIKSIKREREILLKKLEQKLLFEQSGKKY